MGYWRSDPDGCFVLISSRENGSKAIISILLDLLYSNEMSRHCFGLCIPYSWYMSQHIQMVFKMVTRYGFRHSPYCGHFLTIYLTPWSWGLDMPFFVMSQHEMRLLRPVAPAAARLRRVQALSRCIYLTLPALIVLVMLIIQIFAFYDVPFYGDVMDVSSPLYELHTFPIS